MKSNLLRQFIATLHMLSDKECLLAKIELESAPILAGIKPSSLMTFSKDSRQSYQTWEQEKEHCCQALQLCYVELRKTEKYILVLFYNPDLLSEIMASADNRAFLEKMGYEGNLELAVILPLLRKRFSQGCPHEIGLFLGIAREDVDGFIRNNGAACLFCGYWKVYHKPQEASCLFRSFDQARQQVMHSICRRKRPVTVPA